MLNTVTYNSSRFAAMHATRLLMQANIDALQEELDLREETEDQEEGDSMVTYVHASDLGIDQMPAAIQVWLADLAINEGMAACEMVAYVKQNIVVRRANAH